MQFEKLISTWLGGEVLQGKIMLLSGIILCIIIFFIWKSTNSMLKGMLLPAVITTIFFIGFSTNVIVNKPKYVNKIVTIYKEQPQLSVNKEIERLEKESKSYRLFIKIWVVMMFGGIGTYFIFTNQYYKGLSLGMILLGCIALITDSFLLQRISNYLSRLVELVK